jgi:hypothetical protein
LASDWRYFSWQDISFEGLNGLFHFQRNRLAGLFMPA